MEESFPLENEDGNQLDPLEQFQRHDLVWLSASGWDALCAAQPAALLPALRHWQQQEWPAVVRRSDTDAAADEVCIGFAFAPQDGHKLRVAARVRCDQVIEHQPGLALATVLPLVAAVWQPPLRALQLAASTAGLRFRVYGSLAYEFLTGQTYLRADSDIDLLFRPTDVAQLQAGLALLQQYQQQLPLDGEVIFPGAQAVAWKEWLLAESVSETDYAARVLVKDLRQVRLLRKTDLLQSLQAA